jgi:DHA2 family multidrug resistance protein-like MFS transporter
MTQSSERPRNSAVVGRSGRWWALAALALSGLTIGLDSTVLNIALPKMSTALHATTGELQWFSASYTLVVGVLMLPAANLGDRYGRKRFLIGSLVLFAVASGWCAASTSAGELIAARAALGLAGAALLPLGFAMLPTLFPTRGEQGRAVSIWTLASALGLPLGPIVGGLLLNHFWWGSVFVINVPLAAFGAVALAVFLPEARSSHPLRLDVPGTLLSSSGLGAVIYGLINAGQHGWVALGTWVPILAGLALLVAFVAWEQRSSHPLIELALFRDSHFTWGTIHATIANFAFFGLLFAVPQYFQSVEGASPFGSGLRLLPMILGLIVGTQAGSRLAKRFGVGIVIAVGFVLAGIGLGGGASTGLSTGYGFAAAWIALLGLGAGIALPTAMGAALGALSAERAGAGSGLMQALRQVGGSIGVAVLGSVLASGYHSHVNTGRLPAAVGLQVRDSVAAGVAVAHKLGDEPLAHVVRAAFIHGMDLTLIVSGVMLLAGAVLAALFLPRHAAPAPAPAPATAASATGKWGGAAAAPPPPPPPRPPPAATTATAGSTAAASSATATATGSPAIGPSD